MNNKERDILRIAQISGALQTLDQLIETLQRQRDSFQKQRDELKGGLE